MSQVLTLASFQSIASSSVPLGCILAYNNTRLSGCKRSDFQSGTGCSASCQRSIQSVEATLQLVCGDVDVPSGSVLASAINGNLVNTLCGKGLQQPPASTAVVTTTTTVPRESNSPILSTIVPPTSTTTSAAPTTTAQAPTSALPPSSSSSPPRPDTESTSATSTQNPGSTPTPAGTSPERGGGSPFDAQRSAVTSSPRIPRLSLVMSWTFVLLLLIR
ncbi:hypothetical protein MCOR25_004706 [Pyricularia grisea]|nr:hypothetical protein MCOR25_004706 [Pyricularia grisea]